ncbi:hypothetical protein KVP06_17080 [Geobacter sulfurreducens]|uniref:hypothetical protein n=1 Tax=Geobacter sulfurreducens TaxID=35554 RepID=UPI00190F77D0|nr:hypothetical protein [Geobacter sulfurreducens]UAC04044.1 hypothetical protein KVP06_17080 [Geobacter sulfurreducens]UTG92681.1 hypothetical protein J8622_16910 [Geobacter sulfurreducens]
MFGKGKDVDGRGIAQAQPVPGKRRLAGAGKATLAVISVAVTFFIGATRSLVPSSGGNGVSSSVGGVVVRAKTDGSSQCDGYHQQKEKQGNTFSLERENHGEHLRTLSCR